MKRELRNVASAASRQQQAAVTLEMRIREAREAGCSLRQIAAAAGVSYETVRRSSGVGDSRQDIPRGVDSP